MLAYMVPCPVFPPPHGVGGGYDAPVVVYIHIYIHTYIPTYLPTYIHTYLHTYLPTYIPTYLHTYLHTYIPTYIHTYIHSFLPSFIHSFIHSFIYTHIYIYIVPGSRFIWRLYVQTMLNRSSLFDESLVLNLAVSWDPHLPGLFWEALHSLFGSMREVYMTFSAQTKAYVSWTAGRRSQCHSDPT